MTTPEAAAAPWHARALEHDLGDDVDDAAVYRAAVEMFTPAGAAIVRRRQETIRYGRALGLSARQVHATIARLEAAPPVEGDPEEAVRAALKAAAPVRRRARWAARWAFARAWARS